MFDDVSQVYISASFFPFPVTISLVCVLFTCVLYYSAVRIHQTSPSIPSQHPESPAGGVCVCGADCPSCPGANNQLNYGFDEFFGDGYSLLREDI